MAEELSQVLALLRSQRHSFLNHLQVISGWLQLGNGDRAVQYIARTAARMEAEGQVLRQIDSPEVSLFVMETSLAAESYGVALSWRVSGPVDPADLAGARTSVNRGLELVADLPASERALTITLGSSITVHTPSAMGEG